MSKGLSPDQTREMFRYVGEKIIESKPLLTEIDRAIGDGDHGIGMSVGFTEALYKLNEKDWTNVNDIFKTIGMAMISSMGGASGVIFGTMFAGGVKHLPPKETLNLETLTMILDHSLKSVKERGKAEFGDKTMIDALEPAVKALQEFSNGSNSLLGGLMAAEESARVGVENTKSYISKFGRAKSLGERSIGHQDAGATSVWIILKSMREWVEQGNNEIS
ncbi:dihydroxyacetone kinase subunit DhaL [Ammoniphilus sp. 3BR4]|uniref:dihydroxyacetone kinase subunit DhaL n=1 Tax=Ammoniphilus sp. 3BR4 TaxID=3158265 RepID=UPI003466D8ED